MTCYATFGSIENITGGQMTNSRGIRPSRCLLRRVPLTAPEATSATLTLHNDETTLEIKGCAVLEGVNRLGMGRDGWRQDLVVADRRWKWRYPRIDGTYNERVPDGSLRSATTNKSIKDLVSLCLDALGETGYDVSDVPDNVYPLVSWNQARADLELAWLCDLCGMVICPQWATNTFAIRKLNQATVTLPATTLATTPTFQHKGAVIPETLQVSGDPTIVQSTLTLVPVGLDTDGTIVPINSLSYAPGTGWGTQWYSAFPGVAAANRHLAFQTVWRWYAPSGGWDGDGQAISAASQLELLQRLGEIGEDSDGLFRPLPPVVSGVFWPGSDLPVNTVAGTKYSGGFRILSDVGIVEFDHPVIKFDGGAPASPDLSITIGYLVRKAGDSGYSRYTHSKAVSAGTAGAGTRVLLHPELRKTKIVDAVYGTAGDNSADLEAEADAYLDMVEATYDYTAAEDRIEAGLVFHEVNGAIAQVKWKWGNGRAGLTRVGLNTEFDVYTMQHQQQRAMSRLAQLAERMGL